MAKGRVGGRTSGRLRFVLVLLGFLVVATGVILRRSYGIVAARELKGLEAKRAALLAERLRLEAEIRAAASRATLQPIAEHRLQMRVPADSQVIILPRPSNERP
jgi:cell division protein FtsL